MAYHPQTDSQTEQVNQELEQYLRLYYNYGQNDQAEWLSITEFSYNNRIHSSTGRSPFLVNLGHHPNTGQDTGKSTEDSPGTEEFLKTIKEIGNEVEETLKKTNEMMKKKWDANITNGHLLICDWCFRILKGSKMQSLDSDKRCC